MEFRDKILVCTDCGTDFLFTSGEQIFFQERNFRNPPKRCKPCKAKRVSTLPPKSDFAPSFNRNSKIETHTNCSQCGKATTVPFKPTQGRPVLCRECFLPGNQSASA